LEALGYGLGLGLAHLLLAGNDSQPISEWQNHHSAVIYGRPM